MSGTGKRAVRQSIRIAAPPERVYAALTDPAALRGWLCRTAEWADEGRGVLRVGWPGTAFEISFLERVPGKRVLLGWGHGKGVGDRVAFDLERDGAGTIVRLVHDGFDQGDGMAGEWAGAHEGWAVYLCNLLLVTETGRDLRDGQPAGSIAS